MHRADPARAATRALLVRVGGLVFAVALAATLLFTLLARLHFANVNAQLTAERLAVLAERSVAPFVAAARLGLPLDSVRNASGLLERARLADDAILALWVVDPEGRLVHSAGALREDRVLPAAWRQARDAAAGKAWHQSDTDHLVTGIDIPGHDGARAGSLVVLYPGQGERLTADAMLVDLARSAFLAVTAALAAAALLLRPALRPTIGELRRLASAYAAFQHAEWRGVATAAEVAVTRAHRLVSDLGAAAQRYRCAATAMHAVRSVSLDPSGPPGGQEPGGLGPLATAPEHQAPAATALAAFEALRWRLTLLLLATVAVTLGTLGGLTAGAFERAITPELDRRARLVASIVRADLQRAVELGVDLADMPDLDAHLTRARARFDELQSLAVLRSDGTVVGQAGASGAGRVQRLPVLDGNRVIGDIVVTLDPAYARARLRELLLTVLTVGVVAAVLAAELAMRLLRATVVRPLTDIGAVAAQQADGDFRHRVVVGGLRLVTALAARLDQHASDLADRARAMAPAMREAWATKTGLRLPAAAPVPWRRADMADVRLPLLLFTVGAEIAVALLPVHAHALARPTGWSAAWAAALPIAGFVLAMVGAVPLAGRMAGRWGARRSFLIAVPLAIVALVVMASATHVVVLTAGRTLLALPYALALVACQDYALAAARGGARAAAAATFGGVVAAGVLCGAGLGGLLAQRFSVPWAMVAGAGAVLLSAALAWPLMRPGTTSPSATDAVAAGPPATTPRLRPSQAAALCVGLALPMSVATAVLVWYLMPLLLTAAGASPGDVARVLMLYYLATVLAGPLPPMLAARSAVGSEEPGDRGGGRGSVWLLGGAVLAAVSLWPLGWRQDFWWLVAAVSGLGLGHALMRAPLVAMAGGDARLLGRLRLSERFGAASGLAAGALAWPVLGAGPVLQGLALLCSIGTLGSIWSLRAREEH